MSSRTVLDMTQEEWKNFHPFGNEEERSVSGQISKEAFDIAQKIASVLYEKYGADKVILHGSLAKGNFSPWSDIDLAVRVFPLVVFFVPWLSLLELVKNGRLMLLMSRIVMKA